jgi:hypothetical protein
VSGHQQSWDEALATEQNRQRELLATLRGELGAFARDCADALTALDAFVGDLSSAASLASAGQRGYTRAKLVRDLALTVPGETAEGRSDRELLERVGGDENVRTELEQILGPAPVAAIRALQPLSRWIPAIAGIRRGDAESHQLAEHATAEVIRVLTATGELSGSEGSSRQTWAPSALHYATRSNTWRARLGRSGTASSSRCSPRHGRRSRATSRRSVG